LEHWNELDLLSDTPCTGKSCYHGGICFISGSTWYCWCPSGYSGTFCQSRYTCAKNYNMSIYHQPIICMHILECVVIFIAIFRMFIIIFLIKQHAIKTQITCILHARRNSPDIRWFVKLLNRLYICVCGK
jgi:hypothetical protein